MSLTIGSLFSGVGGLELGLERAGFGPVVWQVEIDPFCRSVLERRWPEAERYEDICSLEREEGGFLRKLSDGQVEEAKRLYERGFSYGVVATYFGVTRQAIWELLRARGVDSRPQLRFGEENHFYRGGVRASDRAHNLVEYALRVGVLKRPTKCESCGGTGPIYRDGRSGIHAHHDDYNKPLAIRWLCKRCHDSWHSTNEAKPLEEGRKLPRVDLICGGFP